MIKTNTSFSIISSPVYASATLLVRRALLIDWLTAGVLSTRKRFIKPQGNTMCGKDIRT